jgi:hypothetical protein
MALQIRRGTTAQRLAYVPLEGEPIFDTDESTLYVGDGLTPGGRAASDFGTVDARNAAAELFTNGIHNGISFLYDSLNVRINASLNLADYTGSITNLVITGSIFADDSSTLLVDGETGKINLDGTVKGDIIPDADVSYDIGSVTNRFKDIYLSGSSIYLGDAIIRSSGNAVDLPANSTVDGVPIGNGGGGEGIVEGGSYNISVVGDDSSLIVDSFNRIVTATRFNGPLFGNVNAIEVTTSTIRSEDSTPISFNSPISINANVSVNEELAINGLTTFISRVPDTIPVSISSGHNEEGTSAFTLRRSRGTVETPSSVQILDRLGEVNFNAFDGTNYLRGAGIQARVTGAVSAGVTPTALRFFVQKNNGVDSEVMTLQPTGDMWLYAADVASSPLQIYSAHESGTNASNVLLIRSRGTTVAPTSLENGDPVFDFAFAGHDGTAYRPVSQIRVSVDGPISSNIVPGRFDFFTTNTSGVSASRVQISTTKTTFNNMPVMPTYADETAADTAIGGSGNRVNGMMYYDTALSKVRAVAGGSWVNLH